MARYKICPLCGTRNPVVAMFCVCNNNLLNCPVTEAEEGDVAAQEFIPCDNCGHQCKTTAKFCAKCGKPVVAMPAPEKSVETVWPSDFSPEPALEPMFEPEPGIAVGMPSLRRYKKCLECGQLNDPRVEYCIKCRETLEYVFDLVEAPEQSDKLSQEEEPGTSNICHFFFISTEGYKLKLPIGQSTVGREALMGEEMIKNECFFVSREHLIVNCTESGVEITDISRNGTFVNSAMIAKNIPVQLNPNDLIGLGGVSKEFDQRGYYFTLMMEREG